MTAALARTALRLLVVEALSPTGTPEDGPWPTIAGGKVYDSRLVPAEDIAETERHPVAMIYTDEVEAVPRQTNGRLPLAVQVDLRIEIALPQLVSATFEDEEGETREEVFAGFPQTDPETEAQLDLLESQVVFALFQGPTGALLRRLMPPKLKEFSSVPFRSGEQRVRQAMRSLTFRLTEFPSDCYDMAPAEIPDGLARLPQPLRAVAEALPEQSYGRGVALDLAGRAPVAAPITPLTGMSLTIDASRAVPPPPPPSSPALDIDTLITPS